MNESLDFSGFSHVKFVEHDDSYSIIYSPGGSADAHLAPLFAEQGLEGSGYDWQSLAEAALLDDRELRSRFGFDSEAGMFCAYGEDPAALHAVATIVEGFFADAERVRSLLAVAVANDLID